MKKLVKESLEEFLKESAETEVEPLTIPIPTKTPRPSRPSPFPTTRPSVNPRPKATVEEVAKKFLNFLKK